MPIKNIRKENGDTLIEVLLALTALSMVAAVCYNIMSQGFSNVNVSLERTQAQAMINGQAAFLREAQNSYIREKVTRSPTGSSSWEEITAMAREIETEDGGGTQLVAEQPCDTSGVTDRFYFDPHRSTDVGFPDKYPTGTFQPANESPVYGRGMWIEAYHINPAGNTERAKAYYNFYLKACWITPYGNTKQEMRTIVRLYDPF